jgi:hypothetical protein
LTNLLKKGYGKMQILKLGRGSGMFLLRIDIRGVVWLKSKVLLKFIEKNLKNKLK